MIWLYSNMKLQDQRYIGEWDSAKKIKEISIEQADSMEQVEATAERIAEVVQNNSAAAQETSATSEELTAQATTLSGMVSVFKLRQ